MPTDEVSLEQGAQQLNQPRENAETVCLLPSDAQTPVTLACFTHAFTPVQGQP